MNTTLIILLAFVAGSCMTGLFLEFRTLHKRVSALEEANLKHLPYKSRDAIEDATAGVLYVEQDLEVLQTRIEHMRRLLNAARNPEK